MSLLLAFWWLWSSWSQWQYLCFISYFSGTVHSILSPCCVIQQLLKLNTEILVNCVHGNQPSFFPPWSAALPFIPSTKIQKGDSGRRKGLLPFPSTHKIDAHCGDKMCPPCPSPQSAVSLRQLQPSELMSAVGCGALADPVHHMIHDARQMIFVPSMFRGLSETCKELWSENFQGKGVTLVRTLLTLSSLKSLRGNGKGAHGRVLGGSAESTEQSILLCSNAFSVWIIGPFSEVPWKWLILA